MASRDLTATFIERRSAANVRRENQNSDGGRMKPFGEFSMKQAQIIFSVLVDSYHTSFSIFLSKINEF